MRKTKRRADGAVYYQYADYDVIALSEGRNRLGSQYESAITIRCEGRINGGVRYALSLDYVDEQGYAVLGMILAVYRGRQGAQIMADARRYAAPIHCGIRVVDVPGRMTWDIEMIDPETLNLLLGELES